MVGPMPVLKRVSVSGGSNSPRRVFGFEPNSGSTSAASRQSDHELPVSPTSFLTEALREESSWPHGSLRTGRAGFTRRSFSFPELCSLADPVSSSASSTAPIAVPVPTSRWGSVRRRPGARLTHTSATDYTVSHALAIAFGLICPARSDRRGHRARCRDLIACSTAVHLAQCCPGS